ncbi:MAG: hypothetical protein ACOCV2_08635, partial [Persicimonas sp.]
MTLICVSCAGEPPSYDPSAGDPCPDEGETHDGLRCEDGVWVDDYSDAGQDASDAGRDASDAGRDASD